MPESGETLPEAMPIDARIYTVRGQQVMLDSDLAEVYEVTTGQLNQAVARNERRFPPVFSFQLTENEWDNLRSQIVISNARRGGRRYLPRVFIEHGAVMLASVRHQKAKRKKRMSAVPFPDTLAAFQTNPESLLWKNPGIWLVNKPSGPSSNLWVIRARRALHEKRVGHAGTLDPLASGLLVLLVGNATRLFDQMQDFTKTYVAGFRLGLKTDSQDITGAPVPGFAPQAALPVSRETAESALAQFRGEIMQLPPMHSALKKDGQPLYKLARKGVEVERVPRPMVVSRLELLDFDGVDGVLSMDVSKGFYVRTLIDDFGDVLAAGATMTTLVRTAVGPFGLSDARDDLLGEWEGR